MKVTLVDDIPAGEVKVLIQLTDADFTAITKFDEADRALLRSYEMSSSIADRLLALEFIARRLEDSDGDISHFKIRVG